MPPPLAEFFMAREFGWTLEYIRSLREKDFQIHTSLIEVLYRFNGSMNKAMLEKSKL